MLGNIVFLQLIKNEYLKFNRLSNTLKHGNI